MKPQNIMKKITLFIISSLAISNLFGADWPMWGRDGSRNMISDEKQIIFDFNPGEMNDEEVVDMKRPKILNGSLN